MSTLNEIRFSQEELLYLLRALNLPDLVGMGERPWGHIPQENALLVMETVGRGLVARGIAKFGISQMDISSDIARLLSNCAYPRQMLALTYHLGNGATQRNFLRGREYDVEHALPYPWVHQFQVKTKSDMGFGIVQSLTKDTPSGETSKAYSVPQDQLDKARQRATDDVEAAARLLLDLGLGDSHAKGFAAVLGAPETKVILQAVYDFGKTIRQNFYSILADKVSCWLVNARQPDSHLVEVMQVDRAKLDQIIFSTFQPFIQEQPAGTISPR